MSEQNEIQTALQNEEALIVSNIAPDEEVTITEPNSITDTPTEATSVNESEYDEFGDDEPNNNLMPVIETPVSDGTIESPTSDIVDSNPVNVDESAIAIPDAVTVTGESVSSTEPVSSDAAISTDEVQVNTTTAEVAPIDAAIVSEVPVDAPVVPEVVPAETVVEAPNASTVAGMLMSTRTASDVIAPTADAVMAPVLEKEVDADVIQVAIDNAASFAAETVPAVAVPVLDTQVHNPEDSIEYLDLDEGALIDDEGLPVLYLHQQITFPTTVKVGDETYLVYDTKFISEDETVAIVSESGLVSRVEGTLDDHVCIGYTAAFNLTGYGKIELSDTIKYRVFQYKTVDLDLETKEV